MPVYIDVEPVPLDAIAGLRDAYRREVAAQVVHDSWHARGFSRLWLLRVDGATAGYGAVGGPPREPRDVAKECWILPRYRVHALPLFRALCEAGGARRVEAQTNDRLLTLLLYDCATDVEPGAILFAPGDVPPLPPPAGAVFRRAHPGEVAHAFPEHEPPLGEWVVDVDGVVVAAGGLLFHYNPPYGDIFMDVVPAHQRRGYGGWLVQELARACRAMGRTPAARCQPSNVASRGALERGGMLPCARILSGPLAR